MEEMTSFIKNTKERLDLKNDYVFKRIFGNPENNQELKELLEAILNIKIETVEVKNPEITKDYADEKLGVLDIRAQINEDTMIDIEMQVANVKTMVNRNIAYTSRLIAEDSRTGETYEKNETKRNIYRGNYRNNRFIKRRNRKIININYEKPKNSIKNASKYF